MMDQYQTSTTTPYYFELNQDEPPSVQLIRAVATVSNTSRGELEPLKETINQEVVDNIQHPNDNLSLSFEYADFHVTINNDGSVILRDPDSLHVKLADTANILLMSSNDESDYCSTLLTPYPLHRLNILYVILNDDLADKILPRHSQENERPSNLKFITNQGDPFLKELQSSTNITNNISFENAESLTDLGKGISETIRNWSNNSNQTVICFHSVNELVRASGRENSFKFFHILNERVDSSNSLAHYHLDPDQCQSTTQNIFMPLFDAIVHDDDNITKSL